MSWDIELVEDGHPVTVDRHAEGGTYALGGIDEAELNVTYNYGDHFQFGSLDGKTGREAAPILEEAVARLGTERADDYWDATPGNAGRACAILLAWAKVHPGAVFEVR